MNKPAPLAGVASVAPVTAWAVMRRLVAPVYLPMVLASIGTGMLIPVLPLYLDDVGVPLRTTAIVLAAAGAGAVLGGLPVGLLVGRLGERRVLVLAIAAMATCAWALGLTETAFVLVALRLGGGMASIGLRLSRQTYITRRVDTEMRGRAMASIGGSFRVGLLIGPLIGGVVADRFGFTAAFAVTGAVTASSLISPLLVRSDPPLTDSARAAERAAPAMSMRRVLRTHRRLLLLAGVVPMLMMTVRDGRFVVLPLIGDDLGLSPSVVGAVISVGTAADLVLFPAAGYVMDRFGRLAALLPSLGLIAAGLAWLAAADSAGSVIAAGTVIGVGNGLGSGALLTLGSDIAPLDQTGPFLAAFGSLQDLGKVMGPLVVGVVGDRFGLGAASVTLAALAVGTAAWLVLVVGETSDGGGRLVTDRAAERDLARR